MANEKRLIDANALEAYFHETKMIEIFPYWKELSFKTQSELIRFGKAVKEIMQKAPTVDAVEVVHGKWKSVGLASLKCSKCGYADDWKMYHNYCPNCGAKMDGDSK